MHQLPLFLLKTCQTIFQANLPLWLLLIGLALSFGLDRSEIGLMLRALSVRYVLGFVMAALMVLLPLRLPYGVRTLPAFAVLLPMEFRVNTHLITTSIGVTMELAFLISWLLFGIGISAV